MIIGNAFSLNMLESFPARVSISKISVDEVKNLIVSGAESAIGHVDTAKIVGDILEVVLTANRMNVKIGSNEFIIIAQYSGPRLPEGATTLPDGAKIDFFLVEVK